MADPYELLGVSREATADDIRKAYRRLAKANHPDLNPGDTAAEARFKEISSAYAIVGDEAKRALFDAGKIDATGAETPPPEARRSYREQAESQPHFKYERHWNGTGGVDEDLFAELFGRQARANQRGADVTYTFSVDFNEAILGAKKRVAMGDGRTLDVTIPPGLTDGQTLRMRGQGMPGPGGGEAGDALVQVHVRPHPVLHRDGRDIRSILPVTMGQAMAGAKLPVETVTGTVNLAIPKGSNTGTTLRLRGKGVPSKSGAGDHFVELRVVLPPAPDDALVRAVTEWEHAHPYDPQAGLGAKS
jgi:DnaJ-class molecular chaperone